MWLRSRIFRVSAVVFGLLIAAILSLVIVSSWLTAPTVSKPVDVAYEWNLTIRRLGIEPVYPPQEDISVGDVYLVITEDAAGSELAPSLQGRALYLWHLDLTPIIQETYKGLYVLPDTPSRARPDADGPLAQSARGSVFTTGVDRPHLPLVLFPGFTFAQIRQASAGGSWASSLLNVWTGSSGGSEQTVELRIPAAETYGVPNLVATAFLDEFCEDSRTRPVCTEEGARRQLSMVVGSQIFDLIDDRNRPGTKRYRIGVEIALISRVYLARSIETVTQSSSALGAQARISMQLAETLQRLQIAVPASPSASDARDNPDLIALRRTLEDQKVRLNNLITELSGSGTSAASIALHSTDLNRISITQSLQRPVAIGFRAARRILLQ